MIAALAAVLVVLAPHAGEGRAAPDPEAATSSRRVDPAAVDRARPPERDREDAEMLRDLELLQKLDLLDHLEMFDDERG